jgi:hypothetical protein
LSPSINAFYIFYLALCVYFDSVYIAEKSTGSGARSSFLASSMALFSSAALASSSCFILASLAFYSSDLLSLSPFAFSTTVSVIV